MKKKTITINLYADGTSDIDLVAFEGVGCSAVVDAFRGGDEVKLTRTKPEYSLVQKQKATLTQGAK